MSGMRRRLGSGVLRRKKKSGKPTGNWFFTFNTKDYNTRTSHHREALTRMRRLMYVLQRYPNDADCLRTDEALKLRAMTEEDFQMLRGVTVGALLDLVESNYERRNLRSIGELRSRLKNHVRPYFENIQASELRQVYIENYVDMRLTASASEKSVDNELMIVRRAFRLGLETEAPDGEYLIQRAPKIRLLLPNNERSVYLPPERYEELRDALRQPERLLYILGFHTGWRLQRLLELTWDRVDFERKIISPPGRQAKNKWVGPAPIWGDLEGALRVAWMEHQRDFPNCAYVVNRNGERVADYRDAWHAATAAIGMPELWFHDLRRTAVWLMVQAGVPREAIKRTIGHKTDAMFERYRIFTDAETVRAGAQAEEFFEKYCESKRIAVDLTELVN